MGSDRNWHLETLSYGSRSLKGRRVHRIMTTSLEVRRRVEAYNRQPTTYLVASIPSKIPVSRKTKESMVDLPFGNHMVSINKST